MEELRFEGTMLCKGDAETGIIEVADKHCGIIRFPLMVGSSFDRVYKGRQYTISRPDDHSFNITAKLAA